MKKSKFVSLALVLINALAQSAFANNDRVYTGSLWGDPTCANLDGQRWPACSASNGEIEKRKTDWVLNAKKYSTEKGAFDQGSLEHFIFRIDNLKAQQTRFYGNRATYHKRTQVYKGTIEGLMTHGPARGQLNFFVPNKDGKYNLWFSMRQYGTFIRQDQKTEKKEVPKNRPASSSSKANPLKNKVPKVSRPATDSSSIFDKANNNQD